MGVESRARILEVPPQTLVEMILGVIEFGVLEEVEESLLVEIVLVSAV